MDTSKEYITPTQSDKYYNEGYDANKAGKEFWENPYKEERFICWQQGWEDYEKV